MVEGEQLADRDDLALDPGDLGDALHAANAVAHNTFISILVELGVVGALLLFMLLASMVYSAIRMRYLDRCLWISLLLTWTIGVSALTWEYRKPTWLLFSLLAAHVYSRRESGQVLHMS